MVLAVFPSPGSGFLQSWAMLTPLRILAAPTLALFFLLAGLFAQREPRLRASLSPAAIELVAFVPVAYTWWTAGR